MRVFSKTDIGAKRSENQDRVWAEALSEDAVAAVVCDGMGGENAGSLASQMTIDFVSERFKNGFREGGNKRSIRDLMLNAVITANALVYEASISDENKKGMGTTCVAAIVCGETAYIVNVGDSRAYHIFEDGIQQQTKDHTYIQTLIEDGRITEEESRYHPDRNAITKAIGAESSIVPDYFEIPLQDDSIILLCSDGLHSYGDDAKIAEIILNNPINRVCGLLIDYAIKSGGRDNITAAIIDRGN